MQRTVFAGADRHSVRCPEGRTDLTPRCLPFRLRMDFFEHQERARKRTRQLVVLYGLAVLGIIALVYVAVVVPGQPLA